MQRWPQLSALVLFGVLTSLHIARAAAQPDEALYIFSGDGLTVRVLEWSEDTGAMRGEILRDGQRYLFTGRHREAANGLETVNGTFTVGDNSFDFSTRQDASTGDAVLFTTGGKTYRLLPVTEVPKAKPDATPKKEANPLAEPASQPNGAAPAPADLDAANLPPVLRLKRHDFPDVTMGVPAAYTVLLPEEWSAQGQIEWQPVGEVPFPQLKLEITSPNKGRIRYFPQATFSYIESPLTGREGVPPPQDFPQWVAQAVAQTSPNLRNVRLVKSTRDAKAEQAAADIQRATGGAGGMQQEIHLIVLEYDEDGIRRREEANLTYVRYQPFQGTNGFNSQMWSVFNGGSVSAPVEQFDAHRLELLSVAGTLRPTPQWHVHSQAVIAENSRRRSEAIWQAIRERGRQITQMSEDDYAKYRKDMAAGDAQQRQRVNGIYETDDFKDTDGNVVNLPMHYQHVFSDGKGNYVLSNNSQDKPGELWTPIEPIE